MNRNDTAGILGDSLPDADWKTTLERANRLYEERMERLSAEEEERALGRTVPEWELMVERVEGLDLGK